ncbi:hypothetical protein [Glycomyces sp. YM15]|uniref:hypothetical protein n=1 Tax=Glycomyces sp. YM15 TaxID=2800446 RepID=UPI001964447D|nr:hypothetical protein [Glycomyces sp. YM15]
MSEWRTWREELGDVEAVVYSSGGIWASTPELRLWTDHFPDHNEPLIRWEEITHVLGFAPPLFPANLRTFDIIKRWQPDQGPVSALARDIDVAPVLIAAATCEPDTPAHRALTQFAAEALWRDYKYAQSDIAELIDACKHHDLAWGANPYPVPEPGELDETTTRAGWLDVLERNDDTAAAALQTMRSWTSGDGTMPYAAFTSVDPRQNQWAAEWFARLEPSSWKAAHVLFEEWPIQQYLVDPASGAVAAEDSRKIIRTLVPAAIPTMASLDSVILSGGDTGVWIRDTDGQLWIAPELAGDGVAWGYGGGGPFTLAVTLGRLLDDMASRPQLHGKPNPGLHELCQFPWPDGTVLSRRDLEAARDNGFTPPFDPETA